MFPGPVRGGGSTCPRPTAAPGRARQAVETLDEPSSPPWLARRPRLELFLGASGLRPPALTVAREGIAVCVELLHGSWYRPDLSSARARYTLRRKGCGALVGHLATTLRRDRSRRRCPSSSSSSPLVHDGRGARACRDVRVLADRAGLRDVVGRPGRALDAFRGRGARGRRHGAGGGRAGLSARGARRPRRRGWCRGVPPEGSKYASYVSGSGRASGMAFFSVGGNVGFALGPVARPRGRDPRTSGPRVGSCSRFRSRGGGGVARAS